MLRKEGCVESSFQKQKCMVKKICTIRVILLSCPISFPHFPFSYITEFHRDSSRVKECLVLLPHPSDFIVIHMSHLY